MDNQNKRKLFFRNTDRPDQLPEDTTPTLKFFFKLLWRKAGKLLTLNLLMLFQILPLAVILILRFTGDKYPSAVNPLYAPLLGIHLNGGSPTENLLLSLFGEQLEHPILSLPKIICMIALLAFTAITWGWQNVGATYNLRSMVRGDSCFVFSDYFYAIRRNLKQGLLFGLLDFALLALIFFDIFYSYQYVDQSFLGFSYILILFLAIIYTCMRFYLYLMLITFDLSIRKLLKNALIFSVLGFKRNFMAMLGIAIVTSVAVLLIIGGLSVGISIPLVLPIFYFLPLTGFIGAYAAYPNIQRYMIDPVDSGSKSKKVQREENQSSSN